MQNRVAGDTLTFTNATFTNGVRNPGGTTVFNANGGVLAVDVDFSNGQSDKLYLDNVVVGEKGPVLVNVNAVGDRDRLGKPIEGNGIEVVNVSGTSDPKAFAAGAPVTNGLYAYPLSLEQGKGDLNKNNWFLQFLQGGIRDEAVAAGVSPILGSRTALSTLPGAHDRQRSTGAGAGGNRFASSRFASNVFYLSNARSALLAGDSNTTSSQKGTWGRIFRQNNDFRASRNGFGFDSKLWGAQAGFDLKASDDGNGNRNYAGLYVAYADSSGDAKYGGSKVGRLGLNATTLGAYYTRYSASNWYMDATAQYSRLSGIKFRTATDENKSSGNSYALSLEGGRQFNSTGSLVRELQAQLINQRTNASSVKLSDSSRLNVSSLNVVTGRLGAHLYGNSQNNRSFSPWLRANIWHTFSGKTSVSSLGNSVSTPVGGTSGEVELGFNNSAADRGGWSFYGSVGHLFRISGARNSGWKGTLGVRKGW